MKAGSRALDTVTHLPGDLVKLFIILPFQFLYKFYRLKKEIERIHKSWEKKFGILQAR